MGSVIAQNLSKAIAHKLRMDAVQQRTSARGWRKRKKHRSYYFCVLSIKCFNILPDVSHILHKCMPNSQRPSIEYATFKGSTNMATVRSATASDTMKKFWTIRSGLYVNTLRITRMLPTIVTIIIMERIRVVILVGERRIDRFNKKFTDCW